jgi:hypothetical protein
MKVFNTWWQFGFIFICWFIFASPYFLKGNIPFPSTYLVTFFAPWSATHGMPVKNNAMPDVITQIFPWKRVTVNSWKLGEVPLWNPYSFAGTAQAGNYQTAVFSPINALFFIFHEVDAWSVMVLLQPLLAGIFMMLFLRSLRLTALASTLGSIAFMFCGFMTVWMAYGTLGYAVLYLPLALYAIETYFTTKKRWSMPLLSISIAFSFLSGHLQMSLYVLVMTSAYLVYHLWKKQWREWILPFVFLIFGLFLSAPQLLVSYTTFVQSGRSMGVTRGEIIPWQYLTTVFAPDLYGNPVTRNDWFGHYAEWASFAGVIPLFLALGALLKKFSDRRVQFFGFTGLCALLFAVSSPLNSLIYILKIPILSNSAASRIIVLFSFCIAVLSSFGMEYLLENRMKYNIRDVVFWFGISLGSVMCLWIWLLFLHPLSPEKLSVAIRNTVLPTGLLILAIVTIFTTFYTSKRIKHILLWIVLIFTSFDVLRFSAKWMPYDPKGYVYPEVPVLRFVQKIILKNHARIIGNIGGEVASAFGVPVLEGYDALYQKRYGELINRATDGALHTPDRSVVSLNKQGVFTEDMVELLGAKYLVHRFSDGRNTWAYPFWNFPSYRSIWKDPTYEVFENDAALPRVFMASSYVVARNDQNIFNALFTQGIDRQNTLILESEPDIKPATGAASAVIQSYKPNEVVVQTISDTSKLLFLSDVYDKGWKVTIDAKPATILRADYDFRAVALPKGRHTVRMYFWPDSFTVGLFLSLFGTLGVIGFFIVWKKSD